MATSSYLAALLADGMKPFRYRSRMRALLGLPDHPGLSVGFSGTLPGTRFPYAQTQLTGEFYVPDELLTAPTRPFTIEDVVDWTAIEAEQVAVAIEPSEKQVAERVDQPALRSPNAMHSGEVTPVVDLVIPGTSTRPSPSEATAAPSILDPGAGLLGSGDRSRLPVVTDLPYRALQAEAAQGIAWAGQDRGDEARGPSSIGATKAEAAPLLRSGPGDELADRHTFERIRHLEASAGSPVAKLDEVFLTVHRRPEPVVLAELPYRDPQVAATLHVEQVEPVWNPIADEPSSFSTPTEAAVASLHLKSSGEHNNPRNAESEHAVDIAARPPVSSLVAAFSDVEGRPRPVELAKLPYRELPADGKPAAKRAELIGEVPAGGPPTPSASKETTMSSLHPGSRSGPGNPHDGDPARTTDAISGPSVPEAGAAYSDADSWSRTAVPAAPTHDEPQAKRMLRSERTERNRMDTVAAPSFAAPKRAAAPSPQPETRHHRDAELLKADPATADSPRPGPGVASPGIGDPARSGDTAVLPYRRREGEQILQVESPEQGAMSVPRELLALAATEEASVHLPRNTAAEPVQSAVRLPAHPSGIITDTPPVTNFPTTARAGAAPADRQPLVVAAPVSNLAPSAPGVWSVPAARWFGSAQTTSDGLALSRPTSRRSFASNDATTDTDTTPSSPLPAPPSAAQQVIVIRRSDAAARVPHAYWERRHLSRMRARILR